MITANTPSRRRRAFEDEQHRVEERKEAKRTAYAPESYTVGEFAIRVHQNPEPDQASDLYFVEVIDSSGNLVESFSTDDPARELEGFAREQARIEAEVAADLEATQTRQRVAQRADYNETILFGGYPRSKGE